MVNGTPAGPLTDTGWLNLENNDPGAIPGLMKGGEQWI